MSEYLEEFFPILRDYMDDKKIKHVLENNLKQPVEKNESVFKDNLPENILIYFSENKLNLLHNLVDFSRNFYENSKIRYFNSAKIDTLPYFILSLSSVISNTNKYLLIKHLIFFKSNYQLEISTNILKILRDTI